MSSVLRSIKERLTNSYVVHSGPAWIHSRAQIELALSDTADQGASFTRDGSVITFADNQGLEVFLYKLRYDREPEVGATTSAVWPGRSLTDYGNTIHIGVLDENVSVQLQLLAEDKDSVNENQFQARKVGYVLTKWTRNQGNTSGGSLSDLLHVRVARI